MSRVLELLADLVAIPSINPRCGGDPGGESAVAAYVAAWAEERGWPVELAEAEPERMNAYVTVPGELPGAVILQTHSDTVRTDGMPEPFSLQVRDGKAYARGACDAKGQLAAFMAAQEQVAGGGQPQHSVLLAPCVDEEEQFRGVVALCDWLRRRSADGSELPMGAIVGEPTQLVAVAAHNGVLRGRIVCHGPGGHSSRPGGVRNPITVAAAVVQHLATTEAEQLASMDGGFGSPTLAVTLIEGGEAINIIPREVALSYDRRVLPGEDPDLVWQRLRDDLEHTFEGVTVERPMLADHGLSPTADSPFTQAVLRATGTNVVTHVPFGSDASKIARLGIPALVFGAGSIDRAHKVDEYVEVDQLEQAVAMLSAVLTMDW